MSSRECGGLGPSSPWKQPIFCQSRASPSARIARYTFSPVLVRLASFPTPSVITAWSAHSLGQYRPSHSLYLPHQLKTTHSKRVAR
eukprot:2244578-Rhodomonas_salina.2